MESFAGDPAWRPDKGVQGNGCWFGEYEDNGTGSGARFDKPIALAYDEAAQALYISDFDNQRIRRLDLVAA